jgi:hypothetical protein
MKNLCEKSREYGEKAEITVEKWSSQCTDSQPTTGKPVRVSDSTEEGLIIVSCDMAAVEMTVGPLFESKSGEITDR